MIGFDLFFDCGILRFEGTKLVNNFLLGGSLGGFLANSQKTLSNAGTWSRKQANNIDLVVVDVTLAVENVMAGWRASEIGI